EEFEGVVAGRVREPHRLGEDQEHEEVVFVPPGPRHDPSMRRHVELAHEGRGTTGPGQELVSPAHRTRALPPAHRSLMGCSWPCGMDSLATVAPGPPQGTHRFERDEDRR